MNNVAAKVYRFDWPDRFVVGTLGEPGSRTFFLQAREQQRVTSVAAEKEQCAALAVRIDEVLDELMASEGKRLNIPAEASSQLHDANPLETPVVEQFRAGVISMGWDPSTAQIVVEAFGLVETTEDTDSEVVEPEEILVVRMPVGTARAFAKRAHRIVAAGRPLCPLCAQPIDDPRRGDVHQCELPEGFGEFD